MAVRAISRPVLIRSTAGSRLRRTSLRLMASADQPSAANSPASNPAWVNSTQNSARGTRVDSSSGVPAWRTNDPIDGR